MQFVETVSRNVLKVKLPAGKAWVLGVAVVVGDAAGVGVLSDNQYLGHEPN